VSLYNRIQRNILPVEKPLVDAKLTAVEAALQRWAGRAWREPASPAAVSLREQSLGSSQLSRALAPNHLRSPCACGAAPCRALPLPLPPSSGLQELQWRSDAIDTFIRDALEAVRDLDAVLTTLKDNVQRTQVGVG
jgi:hypothetical protein